MSNINDYYEQQANTRGTVQNMLRKIAEESVQMSGGAVPSSAAQLPALQSLGDAEDIRVGSFVGESITLGQPGANSGRPMTSIHSQTLFQDIGIGLGKAEPLNFGIDTDGRLSFMPDGISQSQLDVAFGRKGFKTDTGLLNLVNLLHKQKTRLSIRGGELLAHAGDSTVSIPLFSSSLGTAAAGEPAIGEYMFKRGSAFSVTSQVATLGGDKENLLLKGVKSFSEHFYDQVAKSLETPGRGGGLQNSITKVLNAQEIFFDLEDSLERRVTDSVGFVDPLQYAGRQKLGRHHLGHANQMLLEITNKTLLDLLQDEREKYRALATSSINDQKTVSILKASHSKARDSVLQHLQRIQGENPDSNEAKMAKRLNLALASQSGEWIFHENKRVLEDGRPKSMFIKMTSAEVSSLSLLPGQEIFDKGRQFQLSRAAMEIDDVQQLPAAVAKIMGHTSAADLTVGSTIRALSADVASLRGRETNVTLGRRTIGAQFLDSRLNLALFGDSGVMMSADLMDKLDYDPTSGHRRHTITTKINMEAIKNADDTLSFRGVLRQDLAKAIYEHREQLNKTGSIKFEQGLALKAHHKMHSAAIGLDPEGNIVAGGKTKSIENFMALDLKHTNDILRDVKSRGMDPSKVDITGIRINQGSGQIELSLAQRGVVTADSGYIFGGHRVSVGQALGHTAVENISGLLNIDQGLSRKVGLVFGDLGLSPHLKDTKKLSFGFNTTLMSNLAEVISGLDDGTVKQKSIGLLTDHLGGKAVQVNIGGKTKIQFQGLGSNIRGLGSDRITDAQFGSAFKTLVGKLDRGVVRQFKQETFAQVDVRELLKEAPGFGDELLKQAAQSEKETQSLLRNLGLSPTTARLMDAGKSKFMTTVIKSMGGDIAVREEEPMAKFGTKATKISVREAMVLSESMDFARGQEIEINGRVKKFESKHVMQMRKKLFLDLIESHPHLFKKDGELDLILQMVGEKPVFEEGNVVKDIKKALGGKEVGQLAILAENNSVQLLNEKLSKGTTINDARAAAKRYDGKLPESEFSKTILGLLDDKGVAQVSDKALLVQGPKGPMLIPSPKTMGFAKEEGFLRLPGGSDFNKLENEFFRSIEEGRSGVKQAQSMYLDLMHSVEQMEEARLRGQENIENLGHNISDKHERLMRILATNMLSKQGLMYNSTIDPNKMGMSARLRLQHAPSVGLFEVGLTEKALENMFTGSRLEGGQELFGARSVQEIIEKAKNGKLFVHAYREPIASGRQMMALKVKLFKDSDLARLDPNQTKIDFSASAFLHGSTVKYGMEGDFDKDSVNLFRLASMSDANIEAIHRGQIGQLEGILSTLEKSRDTLLRSGFGDTQFRNVEDVMAMIGKLRGGTQDVFEGSAKNFTIAKLADIVEPKHATPIVEAYFAGRSYVDHLMTNVMELQSDSQGRNIIRQNFLARVGEEKSKQLSLFLDQANSLFIDQATGGRHSTYNYTDARNITKYMFLKKVANTDSDRGVASSIIDSLLRSDKAFARGSDEFQQRFISDLTTTGDMKMIETRRMVDDIAGNLLKAAEMVDDNKNIVSGLRNIDPQTASLLHDLKGRSYESAMDRARLLSKRMLFTGAIAEMFKSTPGQTPGEGIAKNLTTVIGRIFSGRIGDEAIDPTHFDPRFTVAQSMVDIQSMTSDGDMVSRLSSTAFDERMAQVIEEKKQAAARVAQNAISSPDVPNSSYRNALISGEFFAKISQMKYFKPTAAIVGGLAGIEVVRSAIDRFSPGNVPATGYNSANTMPPPPMISSPQDPTFARDAMPNTNVARVAKHHGQRSSVNISGKMDTPVDFRGVTNNISLNNGYVPNIQGSFRSSLSDTMSQAEMAQFVGDRMGSSF